MNIVRFMQGERPGLGSEFEPRHFYYTYLTNAYPIISTQQEVQLPDVSFYQGEIDFIKMATLAQGVIIRAGQRNWVDIKFVENWASSKEASLPRGTYWFYDSREHPANQAALWWGLVKDDTAELVYVADFEESYRGPYASVNHLREFINEFQRLSNLPDNKIAIYTGYYWWNSRVGNDAFFKRFWLWLAWYGAQENVRIPLPWSESQLLFWQYTASGNGEAYGVSSKEIDLNWYCCSMKVYQEQFNIKGDNMQIIKGIALAQVNRRKQPSTADGTLFEPPRYLMPGDQIEASENSNQWLHLSKINGAVVTETEWSSAGTSEQYISWAWVESEPDPPPTITLTHTIEVYSDGSIRIDGEPYI